jgi:hypothetical protein
MATETTIYVSTKSKLDEEQTQSITDELLRIIGYTNYHPELKFQFIEEGSLIQAHASVDNNLNLSVNS